MSPEVEYRTLIYPEDEHMLRQVCSEVTYWPLQAIQNVFDKMIFHLQKHEALGLAAPQIGINGRIIALKSAPRVMVNPVITSWSPKTELGIEGCLSIPGVQAEIWRNSCITVAYTDQLRRSLEEQFTGMDARVIQHEIDHLNGVLFIDHLDPIERKLILAKYRKLRQL